MLKLFFVVFLAALCCPVSAAPPRVLIIRDGGFETIAVVDGAPANVPFDAILDLRTDDQLENSADDRVSVPDVSDPVADTPADTTTPEEPAGEPSKPASVRSSLNRIAIIMETRPNCPPCDAWKAGPKSDLEANGWKIKMVRGTGVTPTFRVQLEGKEYKHVGYMTHDDLRAIINKHNGKQAKRKPAQSFRSERRLLKSRLPACASDVVTAAFRDPQTIWYTDEEMPPAFQHDMAGNPQATFYSPSYDLSGGADHKRGNGNANMEFPWKSPGGTDESKGVRTIKAMRLPVVDGRRLPVVAWKENVRHSVQPNNYARRLSWRFPEGTQFFEVLYVDDPTGDPWAFSIRMRQRAGDYWDTAVFRPVRAREELKQSHPYKVSPSNRVEGRLTAFHPQRVAFDVSATWEALPTLAADDVRALLSEPFVDCTGVDWSKGVAEPTSQQAFSLVPKDYNGTIVGNTPESCANCHEHVGSHAKSFDSFRDWYGFVRGSDGIFSFLPIEASSIAHNGGSLPVRLRQDLVDSGSLVHQDREPGPPHYKRLKKQ